MMRRRTRVIRAATWISGIVWAWSWHTMYLEIHRWQHVTRSFRFNAGSPIPGTSIRPRPGAPLKFLFVCFYGSPVVFAVTVIAGSSPGATRG